MRITSGEYGGRTLMVPKGDAVRPTQDRVREALFSMLMSVVPGARVLDLFAGSGAVGLEALSRGAVHATLVEADRRHAAVIQKNIDALKCADRTTLVTADAYAWIAGGGAGKDYDFVFADPPYALARERGYADVLDTLAAKGIVAPGGLFVAEMAAHQDPDERPGWDLLRDRTYGQTRLAVYRRLESASEGETK